MEYKEDIKICKKKYSGLNRLKQMRNFLQKYVDKNNKDILLFLIFRHKTYLLKSVKYNSIFDGNISNISRRFFNEIIYYIFYYSNKYFNLLSSNDFKRYNEFVTAIETFKDNSQELKKLRKEYNDIKNIHKIKILLKSFFIKEVTTIDEYLKKKNINLDYKTYFLERNSISTLNQYIKTITKDENEGVTVNVGKEEKKEKEKKEKEEEFIKNIFRLDKLYSTELQLKDKYFNSYPIFFNTNIDLIYVCLNLKKSYEEKLKNTSINLEEEIYYKYRLNRIYKILNINFKFYTPFKYNYNKINNYLDSLILRSKIILNNYRILYLQNYEKDKSEPKNFIGNTSTKKKIYKIISGDSYEQKQLNKSYNELANQTANQINADNINQSKKKYIRKGQGIETLKKNKKIINKRIQKLEKKINNLNQKLDNLDLDSGDLDFRMVKIDQNFLISKINKSFNNNNIPENGFVSFINENIKSEEFQNKALELKNEFENIKGEAGILNNNIKSYTMFTDNNVYPRLTKNDKIDLLILNLFYKTMPEEFLKKPDLIFEDNIQEIFKDNKNVLKEINSRSSIVNNQEPSNLVNKLVPAAVGLFALYKKFKK
jgi:hypothetical protein